ncbi:MAG: hypothetical protein ACLQDV_25875 [Candidatus Binataceae bacterium]
MKILRGIILVVGFLTLFMAGLAGMIIAGVGPGSVERAIAALASAVAGSGMMIAGAMLKRSE